MPKRAILLAFEDFDSMEMWLKNIDARYNSVSLNRIGVSIENRTIYVVKINDKLTDRPIILLEGGAHSREWIASASILYLIEKLASYSGKPYPMPNALSRLSLRALGTLVLVTKLKLLLVRNTSRAPCDCWFT